MNLTSTPFHQDHKTTLDRANAQGGKKMNKLAALLADGKITVEDLANSSELIDRAKLVTEGIEACKKTLIFPLGTKEINCYSYTDSAGEYSAWGTCTFDGIFTCSCNWGGNHIIGSCDLNSFYNTFMAFQKDDFATDLSRFLNEQIEKAKAN